MRIFSVFLILKLYTMLFSGNRDEKKVYYYLIYERMQ